MKAPGKFRNFLKKVWKPVGFIIAPPVFVIILYFIALAAAGLSTNDLQTISDVYLMNNAASSDRGISELDPASLAPENLSANRLDMSEIQFPTYENPYGEIIIESAGIQCPLIYGDSEVAIHKGAGQYIGSRIIGYPGTTLICAHVNRHFANLHKVQVGDMITVRTTYGVYTYKTVYAGVYSATDPEAFDLNREDENIALYTCYYEQTPLGSVKKRFFVRADYVSGPLLFA